MRTDLRNAGGGGAERSGGMKLARETDGREG